MDLTNWAADSVQVIHIDRRKHWLLIPKAENLCFCSFTVWNFVVTNMDDLKFQVGKQVLQKYIMFLFQNMFNSL